MKLHVAARAERAESEPTERALEPTEREFRLFRELIEEEAGIHLNTSKKALLHGRLIRRIKELSLDSFGAYYRRIVDEDDENELVLMLDRITTNETHFFREPHHFEYLERELFPAFTREAAEGTRSKHIRAWSAGCSTGEEPYSLAMALIAHFPESAGWTFEIRATDLSTRVLDAARRAIWPIEKSDEIPKPLLRRFMMQGVGAQKGKLRAGPELREIIHFGRFNLNSAKYPAGGPFDLVFCRNVLIYFESARKQHVLDQLTNRLAPGGRLFVGHAESVQTMGGRLSCVCPTIYAPADAASPALVTKKRAAR